MEIIFWSCFSLLLISPCLSSPSLSLYSLNLPEELRPSALSALRAENASYKGMPQPASPRCRRDVEQELTCPPAKFRRPDGTCNNIIHAKWGARGDAMARMVEPQYADGKSKPRISTSGRQLPSPDAITSVLQKRPPIQHKYVTTLLGAWGELLLQDLVTTVNPRSEKCCTKHQTHPECYAKLGKECKEYMRSVPAVSEDQECQFKYRDQMNIASSFLDGSAIYGSTDEDVESLRTYDAGLVNISACASCVTNALYAALLREHNRVAVNLAKLNRHWHDDTLFLEAKRIVSAEIQHITYNEFLTTVLGEESVHQSDLKLQPRGHYSDYSSSNRVGVYNEVALSALPAFLSMVPASFMNKTTSTETFAFMVSQLIRTPAYMPSIHIDVKLRSDWETSALLIHMGRDHGIAAYPYWVRYCSGHIIDKNIQFDDLLKFGHNKEGVDVLKSLYTNPMDIDLLPGALLESPLPGSLVGPTFSCLLKHQFALLKRSDRFWYENDLPPSSLTLEQLREIRKVTLAGLLCANTDGLNKIQPMAFVAEDPYLNARITCDQHPLPQLTAWIEMSHMTDLSDEILMEAMEKAEQEVLQRRKMEYESWATFGGVDPKSPTGTAASFSKANKAALKLANTSLLFEFASNEILNQLSNTRRKRQIFENNVLPSVFRDDLTDGLQNVDVSSLIPAAALDFEPSCDDSGPCDPNTPFRTFSGHCNNLRNVNSGKSLTTFARLLPAAYEDGISKPRSRSVTGIPLPNPRTVSVVIHPDISNLHTRYTLMVMQFAQFLDHDLTMTPVHKGFHESIPDCRSCDSPRTVHPECRPFPIPSGDHYYPEVNVTSGQRMCFPFMRSLPGQQHLGPREQVNQNTAFLDASQVYGENACVARDLKGFGGRMNSTLHPIKGKELLPQSPHHPECKAPSGYCFIAGDGRASEQPALTSIHTLFLREHNRVVEGLRGVNPHWDSEKLFEHARRIVIAENQHVTYNEFLPRLLSWNAVNLYGLKLLSQGYYKDYNPSCNPSIVTEFASAAFRMGHSLLRPHIPRLSPTYQVIDPPILLRDGFFKPDMLMQPQMIDEIMRGLVSTPMEALDQFITGEVTNHLFEDRRIPFSGIDLVAMNIQRARDHGIPSYNNYRALCNLKRATSFEDLAREIPPEVITRLKRIYPTVDDIDLFPGGMSERPLQGGLVGPTFACIIAIQFRQLRKCDRFWYENEDPAVRFTEAQLAEIRKITLAKIICENLDIPSDMQRAALDLPSNFLNPRVSCQSLPQLDLSAWRESTSSGCIIADRHVGVGESAFPTPCTSCVCTAEGAQCASLRVTDCTQLMREWSRDTILRDDVCTAQCGFLLRENLSARSSGLHTDLIPPPAGTGHSRHVRARRLNNNFNPTFQGFKLPDLTPFVA